MEQATHVGLKVKSEFDFFVVVCLRPNILFDFTSEQGKTTRNNKSKNIKNLSSKPLN